MNMTRREKEAYELYTGFLLKAMDYAIAEKLEESIFYDGMALGTKRSVYIFISCRTEYAALLERTYQMYADYVNGNTEYAYDEAVAIIKEGRA